MNTIIINGIQINVHCRLLFERFTGAKNSGYVIKGSLLRLTVISFKQNMTRCTRLLVQNVFKLIIHLNDKNKHLDLFSEFRSSQQHRFPAFHVLHFWIYASQDLSIRRDPLLFSLTDFQQVRWNHLSTLLLSFLCSPYLFLVPKKLIFFLDAWVITGRIHCDNTLHFCCCTKGHISTCWKLSMQTVFFI